MTRNYIDLVGKTLTVLEALDRADPALPIAELAKQTSLGKSTLFRILYSLKEHGYVEQRNSRGAYSLTLAMARLGRGLLDRSSLRSLALPYMEKLLKSHNESVALALLENGQPMIVEILESTNAVRVVTSLAAVCYFHCSSLGKVMAAYLPKTRVEQILYIQGMPKLTEKTITSEKELFKHLFDVKTKGYAVNFEEGHRGAVYIAAPIFDGRNSVAGSMCLGLPTVRYTQKRERQIAVELKEACAELSRELGCDLKKLSAWRARTEPPIPRAMCE